MLLLNIFVSTPFTNIQLNNQWINDIKRNLDWLQQTITEETLS